MRWLPLDSGEPVRIHGDMRAADENLAVPRPSNDTVQGDIPRPQGSIPLSGREYDTTLDFYEIRGLKQCVHFVPPLIYFTATPSWVAVLQHLYTDFLVFQALSHIWMHTYIYASTCRQCATVSSVKKRFIQLMLVLLLASGAAGGGYWYLEVHKEESVQEYYDTPEEAESVYVRLAMETYDMIMEQYWQEVDDVALSDLYRLSLARALEKPEVTLATTTRSGVAAMIKEAVDTKGTDEEKKELTLTTLTVVLYNLAPAGRSQLYTQVDETALRNRVANINPEKDLYADLGVESGANSAAVQAAFEAKRAELAASSSPEAVAELARVEYAHSVLADDRAKERYDTEKVEPTVVSRRYGNDILYLDIAKISPTSLQEFIDHVAREATATTSPRYLIIDFRGNEGGALDFAPYLLGTFIGPNQYTADLYNQGEREVMRTPEQIPRIAELQAFEDIVILTDSVTQSTAELTASVFKRLNLATVVGTKTRGWGTVENSFPLTTKLVPEESYLVFLVHSLTLRDDQQPVESNGVIPDVSIEEEGWETTLAEYVSSVSLRNTVIELIKAENAE